MKLSQEDKENIYDTIATPGWEAILKTCEMLVANHASRVLSCDLKESDREMMLRKARYEGAQELTRSLMNIREVVGSKEKKK